MSLPDLDKTRFVGSKYQRVGKRFPDADRVLLDAVMDREAGLRDDPEEPLTVSYAEVGAIVRRCGTWGHQARFTSGNSMFLGRRLRVVA